MVFEHDFEKFPELTNAQLETHQFNSPHPQIIEDFEAEVVEVHDGDSVTLTTSFRDFTFPLRLLDIDAPELNEGGKETGDWLRGELLGNTVMVLIDARQRVGKYGRLLGRIMFRGLDMADVMLRRGLVVPFGEKKASEPPPVDKIFALRQWF